MDYWKKRRKSGKKAEKQFMNSCKKKGELCIRANDLLYFLIHRRIPSYAMYDSEVYRENIKKTSRYLSKEHRKFLKILTKSKAQHLANAKGEFLLLKGIPDFAVCNLKRKKVYFVEVKAPKSRLSKAQRVLMRKLVRNGLYSIIVYPEKYKGWTQISTVM